MPQGKQGTADEQPARPEEDEEDGVSTAEDKDCKFVKDAGADFLDALGVPGVDNCFGGHGECVFEKKGGGEKCVEESMSRADEENGGDKVRLQADE